MAGASLKKATRTLTVELESTASSSELELALEEGVRALERALYGFSGADGSYIRSVAVGSPATK